MLNYPQHSWYRVRRGSVPSGDEGTTCILQGGDRRGWTHQGCTQGWAQASKEHSISPCKPIFEVYVLLRLTPMPQISLDAVPGMLAWYSTNLITKLSTLSHSSQELSFIDQIRCSSRLARASPIPQVWIAPWYSSPRGNLWDTVWPYQSTYSQEYFLGKLSHHYHILL